jgi:hypothetical protein
MRQPVLNTVAAMVVAMSAASTVGVGTAAAGPPGSGGETFLSFAQTFRRCDFSSDMHTGPIGVARPTALVHTTGSEVIADVVMVTATPANRPACCACRPSPPTAGIPTLRHNWFHPRW